MGKTIFYYGVMASNKTLQLLTSAYNYKKKGTKYALIKPSSDNRSGNNIIGSRVGLSATADYVVSNGMTEMQQMKLIIELITKYDVLLFDECQFLPPKFIKNLLTEASFHDIVIMAYGLLKDFQGNLFEGSEQWLLGCDSLREIKTECEKCNRKAIYNVRFNGNTPVFNGETVVIGDGNYHVFCAKHKNELEGKVKHIVKTN